MAEERGDLQINNNNKNNHTVNSIMILNKLINARCTLQMLQCMTVHLYSLNVNKPRGDVARGKTYEKAYIWHLFVLINYGSIPPCIFILKKKL